MEISKEEEPGVERSIGRFPQKAPYNISEGKARHLLPWSPNEKPWHVRLLETHGRPNSAKRGFSSGLGKLAKTRAVTRAVVVWQDAKRQNLHHQIPDRSRRGRNRPRLPSLHPTLPAISVPDFRSSATHFPRHPGC